MMKKILIIILSIICALCLSLTLIACDSNNDAGKHSTEQIKSNSTEDNQSDEETETIKNDGLSYKLSDDGSCYSVAGIGTYTDTNLIIPATYEGLPVTSVDSYAFRNITSIESVTITESLTKIGTYAFFGCTSLKGVYITDIATWCNIEFSLYSNPLIYAHNLYLYDSSSSEYESIYELTIPDSVTAISSYAFYGCNKLAEVTFPDGLESIGYRAFYYCSSLTDIVIPDSVTSIGSGAFARCSKITSITLPFTGSSPKTSSDTYQYPFGYIFGTESYTGGTGIKQRYYGDSLSSTTYETYYIPSNLTSVKFTGKNILYGAFYGCVMLKSVTIGENVKFIDDYAFKDCTTLIELNYNATEAYDLSYNTVWYDAGKNSDGTAITIGANVARIPNYMFYPSGSAKFISLTFENNCICESIGDSSFYDCEKLTSITITDNIKSIGDFAFSGCTSLTSIYFNATSAYDLTAGYWISRAGQNGEGISLIIGANVTKIPNNLFDTYSTNYAPKLTNVTFEDNSVCASIGEYAFYGCTQLNTVVIPKSITKIGKSAFNGCNTLESLTFENTSNWYVTRTEGATGTAIDVTDTILNVTYLADTYKYYYWYRN